jgi:site-specific DNA-methyltransferase (adenine-specific)
VTQRVLLADGAIDLRLGRWQDVLADVTKCDAVISDPPYSARTHDANDGLPEGRQAIAYAALDDDGAREIVDAWAPRVVRWLHILTDSVLMPTFRARMAELGLYDFAPLPIVYRSGVRIQGDGPASCVVYSVVARPRTRHAATWRSLPGWYEGRRVNVPGVLGAKDLGLMRAIIRDYTMPGDLVVDPFCGSGTTALACAMEGRRCITSEVDPSTFSLARTRLERGFTPDMFTATTEAE